jgi:hypothetical protein
MSVTICWPVTSARTAGARSHWTCPKPARPAQQAIFPDGGVAVTTTRSHAQAPARHGTQPRWICGAPSPLSTPIYATLSRCASTQGWTRRRLAACSIFRPRPCTHPCDGHCSSFAMLLLSRCLQRRRCTICRLGPLTKGADTVAETSGHPHRSGARDTPARCAHAGGPARPRRR